jgi:hypothetical protein
MDYSTDHTDAKNNEQESTEEMRKPFVPPKCTFESRLTQLTADRMVTWNAAGT